MKKVIAVSLVALTLAVAMGGVASAAIAPLPTGESGIPTGITTAEGFIQAMRVLTDWLFVILTVVAVIFIVLAGLQFITGGGDPQAVSQARNKLLWGAVGIAVAVLARGLETAVRSLIGS